MKCKVRLSRTVEMFVEAENEEDLMDWLRCTTPEEAFELSRGNGSDSYDEEILCYVDDNSVVDYVVEEDN